MFWWCRRWQSQWTRLSDSDDAKDEGRTDGPAAGNRLAIVDTTVAIEQEPSTLPTSAPSASTTPLSQPSWKFWKPAAPVSAPSSTVYQRAMDLSVDEQELDYDFAQDDTADIELREMDEQGINHPSLHVPHESEDSVEVNDANGAPIVYGRV